MSNAVTHNQFQHLIVFDLTSYSSAISIINQFVDDERVKVFEVSPCGSYSFLILICRDFISAKLIYSQVINIFSSSILDSCLIENISYDLLQTYLAQKSAEIKSSIIIFESNKLASSFLVASEMILKKEGIIDFRVIRTQPAQIIVTTTYDNNSIELFDQIQFSEVKKHLIENVTAVVKSYYQN